MCNGIASREASRMPLVKTLWASVQSDPVFMRRVNGWMTIFWVVMIAPSFAFGWVNSVMYVSFLSLWALVSGHWATWQAARTEVRQEEAAKLDRPARDEPRASSRAADEPAGA